MESVLRSVELATNISNNTDLNALLASRLDGGHLPEPDLSAPHPFRGSAPGAHSYQWTAIGPCHHRRLPGVLMPVATQHIRRAVWGCTSTL